MALNVPGLIAVIIFYSITLATGLWAAWKAKKSEKNKTQTEIAIVGGRNLNIFVGLFTTTGAVFFVKPMRSKNYVTMMDPLQETFGDTMGSILFIPSLLGDIFWFASILASLGATVSIILDVKGYLSIIISGCTVILYTLLGGLYSVAYTDVIQLLFMIVSLWVCVPFALLNSATENIAYTAVHELYQGPWIGKIQTEYIARWLDDLAYLSLGGIAWQTYFQRVLAASSSKQAMITSYLSGILCAVMGIPSILIGAVAASTGLGQRSSLHHAPFHGAAWICGNGTGFPVTLCVRPVVSEWRAGICAVIPSALLCPFYPRHQRLRLSRQFLIWLHPEAPGRGKLPKDPACSSLPRVHPCRRRVCAAFSIQNIHNAG
ncbi:hypothetical protein FKM82_009806 [Ascaphus truei]